MSNINHSFDSMNDKIKRGGKREGAGRKPVENPKKPITIYVEENKITDDLKDKLYKVANGIQDLTKPTNEVKPPEIPQTNTQKAVYSEYEIKQIEERMKILQQEINHPPKGLTLGTKSYISIRQKELTELQNKLK